jgi:hypothetical protein
MSFNRGRPTGIDLRTIQRGIDATLTTVAGGAVTRCGNTIAETKAAIYSGAVHICIVATNDNNNGLTLRSISHVMNDGRIVGLPLDLYDADYFVGNIVAYAARKNSDGKVSELIAKLPAALHPVLGRLQVVVADVLRQSVDLRRAPIFQDLGFLTQEGWEGYLNGNIVVSVDDPRIVK